ncbi:MAG: CRTAC1 family protein [Planctomycetota bacterium]|nr:CRTAC1 family protein [Planctomycetota bacterium]
MPGRQRLAPVVPPARRPARLSALVLVLHAAACTERSGPGEAGERPLFREISPGCGVDVKLVNGATGLHFLVETMIGGIGWIDHDGDGDYDLYVANGHESPAQAAELGKSGNRLYANDGSGRFTDVTAKARVGDRRYSNGVAVGDYDGDGDSDLLVTNFGRNTLYRNGGDGTFEDVTVAAGITREGYNMSAVWFDFDHDGDLDLYITRYLDYRPSTARPCRSGDKPVYCHPRYFSGLPDLLYENRGSSFVEIGRRAGIARSGPHEGKGLGVIAADLDRDGWTDLYVANDTTPNFLWRNRGDGSFEDIAPALGVALNENGATQAGMGVDWGDVNGDGLPDIHVTNYSGEMNNLYVALGGGGFLDSVGRAGLEGSFPLLGFGTLLADFDLDGDLDIVVANGHVNDLAGERGAGTGITYEQSPALYLNDGAGEFREGGARAGPFFRQRRVGRGLASADIDGDGDLDLAVSSLDRPLAILRNEASGNALQVTLVGTKSPRDGYGARLEIEIGSTKRVVEYQSARSYLSAVDPRVVVGLGAARRIDRLTVRWSSGVVQVLEGVEAGRITIEEKMEE